MMNNLSSGCCSITWKMLPRQGMIWWQMYRCNVMQSIKRIENKLMAFGGQDPQATVPVVQRNARTMVPQHRFGMWCKAMMLPTSFAWTGLQPQRAYVTKPKHNRYDKFGRKIDKNDNEQQQQTTPKKKCGTSETKLTAESNLNKKRSTEKCRNVAKQRTARSHKLDIRLAAEGQFDNKATLDYGKSKITRHFYLKNKYLLMDKTTSGRNKRKGGVSTKSTAEPQSTIKKRQRSTDPSDIKFKSEQSGLKHLLADLLDRKPKKEQSPNYEYMKSSPIFKLIKHNAERRNCLRAGFFHKQLEIPTIFKHPLDNLRGRKINTVRRTILGPSENLIEKRTKSALKTKLCLLLQDHKDQDYDVD
ncbi:hypothetical protein KR215_006913 [Drosophila sulfurigaster]|nr:hypothetical protein KR215_006913 [Drosophila sulfurigaster]